MFTVNFTPYNNTGMVELCSSETYDDAFNNSRAILFQQIGYEYSVWFEENDDEDFVVCKRYLNSLNAPNLAVGVLSIVNSVQLIN